MKRVRRSPVRVVLAVGGSDSSGGAGIQADVRTLEHFGVAAATAVTAVTVQTGAQVRTVRNLAPRLVAEQMRAVLETQPVRAVKCGMLGSPAVAGAVAEVLAEVDLPLVLDPVAFATGGTSLGGRRVIEALLEGLVPRAYVVTANRFEAETLTGVPVHDEASMAAAAREIVRLGARSALIKGGHTKGRPVDVLYHGRRVRRFDGGERYRRDLHGSGCALASAVAAGLASGRSLPVAVADAVAHVRVLIDGAWKSRDGGWLRRPVRPAGEALRHSPAGSSRRTR